MKKYTEIQINRVRKELAKFIRMKRNTVKACRWSGIAWKYDKISFDKEKPTKTPYTMMTINIPFINKIEENKK